jgi:hypothetical protein
VSALTCDFLLCSERGGSNLTTRIIGAHPAYCAPSPSHLHRGVALNLFRYGDLAAPDNVRALRDDMWDLFAAKLGTWRIDRTLSREDFDAVAPFSPFGQIRWLYGQEAALEGKDRAFIKEVRPYKFGLALEQHYPDARYLYVVRDPRDMALSWKKSAALRGGVVRASQVWAEDQEGFLAMTAWLKPAGRTLTVRYEDLIGDAAAVVPRICAFLGVDMEPGMLEFHSASRGRDDASATADWANIGKPLLADNAGKFRDELTDEEGRYVEAVCRDWMGLFDYPLHYTRAGEKEDLGGLRQKLMPAEPWEKPQYQRVSAEERQKRARWHEVCARMASRNVARRPP